MKFYKYILLIIIYLLMSCTSSFLKNSSESSLDIDNALPNVHIKELTPDPNLTQKPLGALSENSSSVQKQKNIQILKPKNKSGSKSSSRSKSKLKLEAISAPALSTENKRVLKKQEVSVKSTPRLPEYESEVGFTNGSRRPDKDPFRVGEKVVYSVSYFGAKAGILTIEVLPFVEVNGVKSYRWVTSLKSTDFFSKFYSADDVAETLVDFETLIPSVFTLNVKESGQLKNAKGYFDPKTLKAIYVEKKFTENNGNETKQQEWSVLPFSQNVFSAAFYMRIFSYEVGKEYKFNVGNDEKNVLFRGKAIRKEKIEIDAGTYNTVVIKPEFEVGGVFSPVGDIYFWLTDDDRKLIVKIESKIKIGSLVMEATSVQSQL